MTTAKPAMTDETAMNLLYARVDIGPSETLLAL